MTKQERHAAIRERATEAMPPLIVRTPGAARYLGLSPGTLEKMRIQGTGPRFTRLGTRAVGYFIQDLNEFAESGRLRSTSDTRETMAPRTRKSLGKRQGGST